MRFEEEIDLLEAVQKMLPNSKRNTLRRMLTEGRIRVDGKIIHKARHTVSIGAEVSITDRSSAAEDAPPPQPKKKEQRLVVIGGAICGQDIFSNLPASKSMIRFVPSAQQPTLQSSKVQNCQN